MATDPKKDQEIRDEQLDDAAGGRVDPRITAGGSDEESAGGTTEGRGVRF